MKLTLDLIPSSSFFKNVRSHVSSARWDVIREKAYKKANYRCEICKGVGSEHPVECHEVFEYKESTWTQVLIRLIALCPMCHCVKHWGLSQLRGIEDECYDHLCRVNGISKSKAVKYVLSEFAIWEKRSDIKWKLDLSLIEPKKIKDDEFYLGMR